MDTRAYSKPGIRKWLLILPTKDRLYTSVIVLNPEITGLKVSWPTDMSPTALSGLAGTARTARPAVSRPSVRGRGVPGVVGTGVGWEGYYTGYHQYPPRTPYLTIFSLGALPTAK